MGLFDVFRGRHKPQPDDRDFVEVQPPHTIEPENPGFGFESIIGDDNREEVKYPHDPFWRPYCYLISSFSSGKPGEGTGVLIAPDMVLTAAHNIYALDLGEYAKSIEVFVGVKKGQHAAKEWANLMAVPASYRSFTGRPKDPERFRHDFGVLRIQSRKLFDWSQSFLDVLNQPVPTDAGLGQVQEGATVAGYPYDFGRMRHRVLMTHTAAIDPNSIETDKFGYRVDTKKGQSGAPVLKYFSATDRTEFCGVHVSGGGADGSTLYNNEARRFDSGMKQQIESWRRSFSQQSTEDVVGMAALQD